MPVVLGERQIGSVTDVKVEGGSVTVSFHVLRGYQPLVRHSPMYVGRRKGRFYDIGRNRHVMSVTSDVGNLPACL